VCNTACKCMTTCVCKICKCSGLHVAVKGVISLALAYSFKLCVILLYG
jgi:hypothetical protein